MQTNNIVKNASIATAQPVNGLGLVRSILAAAPDSTLHIDWQNHHVAVGNVHVGGRPGQILEALALMGAKLTALDVAHMVASGVFGKLTIGSKGDVMVWVGKSRRPLQLAEVQPLVRAAYKAAYEAAKLKGRILFLEGRGVLDAALVRDASGQATRSIGDRLSAPVEGLLARYMRDGACYRGYWDERAQRLVPLLEEGEVVLDAEELQSLWGLRGVLPAHMVRAVYERATEGRPLDLLGKGGKISLGFAAPHAL